MQVAEHYGSKCPSVGHLQPTALYALASAEADIQAEVEAMITAGMNRQQRRAAERKAKAA